MKNFTWQFPRRFLFHRDAFPFWYSPKFGRAVGLIEADVFFLFSDRSTICWPASTTLPTISRWRRTNRWRSNLFFFVDDFLYRWAVDRADGRWSVRRWSRAGGYWSSSRSSVIDRSVGRWSSLFSSPSKTVDAPQCMPGLLEHTARFFFFVRIDRLTSKLILSLDRWRSRFFFWDEELTRLDEERRSMKNELCWFGGWLICADSVK